MNAAMATTLVQQLEEDQMDLMAITDTHILVLWHQDKSYVSWKWSYNAQQKYYGFAYGVYMPVSGHTADEAMIKFKERINE